MLSYHFDRIKAFSNWLLPQSCFLCGANNQIQPLCATCLSRLPYQEIAEVDSTHLRVHALFNYSYPITTLIHAAKYHANFAILTLLGHLMAKHLDFDTYPDVLIPVPLHAKRLRWRGYNQSLELAKPIHRQTKIPLVYDACVRNKETQQQAGLSAKERQDNVKNVFQVKMLKPAWQHIVLIDDVVTTGATINELAQVFLQAGVPRVEAWCCAKA